jgi:hypothetical protein
VVKLLKRLQKPDHRPEKVTKDTKNWTSILPGYMEIHTPTLKKTLNANLQEIKQQSWKMIHQLHPWWCRSNVSLCRSTRITQKVTVLGDERKSENLLLFTISFLETWKVYDSWLVGKDLLGDYTTDV